MYKKLFITLILFCMCYLLTAAESLPDRHRLLKNEQGEYYVENKDKVVMIDPAIIAIGHNSRWIVACVKNESIDTDLKRYYFINLKNGGTTDTINQENWEYFINVYEGLSEVETKPLSEESCP